MIGDPVAVARKISDGIRQVREFREERKDAYYFNWSLHIPLEFQQPFIPTHEAVAALDLHHSRPVHALAADLRRAFSSIVAGNVRKKASVRSSSSAHSGFMVIRR